MRQVVEANLDAVAATLVLMTAMINPWFSLGLCLVAFTAIAVYGFRRRS